MAQVTQRFNISTVTGSYQSNGETKNKWATIGEATQWDDGSLSYEIHSIPLGAQMVGVLKGKMFPKENAGKQETQTSSTDGDIPF